MIGDLQALLCDLAVAGNGRVLVMALVLVAGLRWWREAPQGQA